MKIALIGATGFVGSAILKEALDRGHRVTAIVRNPAKLDRRPGLTGVAHDVENSDRLTRVLGGHDAVISAYNPGWDNPDIYRIQVRNTESIIRAVKQSGVQRLLMVGGAGSLEVEPGVQLVDTPAFPEQWKGGALATREALNLLRMEPDLEWTFLSPSPNLFPGERTGKFRLGGDQVLQGANGKSEISVQDFAVALIDELEKPQHVRLRFTVGY